MAVGVADGAGSGVGDGDAAVTGGIVASGVSAAAVSASAEGSAASVPAPQAARERQRISARSAEVSFFMSVSPFSVLSNRPQPCGLFHILAVSMSLFTGV